LLSNYTARFPTSQESSDPSPEKQRQLLLLLERVSGIPARSNKISFLFQPFFISSTKHLYDSRVHQAAISLNLQSENTQNYIIMYVKTITFLRVLI